VLLLESTAQRASAELSDVIERLEELLGEDGMMDLSLESLVGWVNTLKQD
jgi:hypothetical protein